MAEINLEKMVEKVAEDALNNYKYNGLYLREWIEMIALDELLAVKELEEILREMDEEYKSNPNIDYVTKCRIAYIIHKHIAKLKGESK